MGKKDKGKKKKGLGIEKTNAKTDKKLLAKQKKLLQKIGEDDIENIVTQLQSNPQAIETTETVCAPPSPRSNLAIAAFDDLIYLQGGEFFNGAKVECFSDFFVYNTNKNEWKILKSSPCPAPRSGHQMISTKSNGGELWLFGGEFASPSGLQFYHFRDLWKFSLASKKWEQIKTKNSPSARSGHRMILHKKKIIMFGGFHDNNQTFLYHNDVWVFSMDNYEWTKIETEGIAPSGRSGVGIGVVSDDKLIIFGGYTKSSAKAGSERGVTHADAFLLQETPTKWKWSSTKIGGKRPTPRSGVASTTAQNGKIYIFGGVMDTEEDDENLRGLFSNEVHFLDIQSGGSAWRKVELKKKKEIESPQESSAPASSVKTKTDGIFTITVAGPKAAEVQSISTSQIDVGGPSGRMNAAIAVVRHNLYVFGGSYEQGSRQYTLCDFYSLDVNKLDAWRTHVGNLPSLQWLGSDSEDDSDKSDDDEEDDDDSESDSDNDSDEMEVN